MSPCHYFRTLPNNHQKLKHLTLTDDGKSFCSCLAYEKLNCFWLVDCRAKQEASGSLHSATKDLECSESPPIPVPNPFIKTLPCKTASLASGQVNNFPCRDNEQQTSGGRAKNGLLLPTHLQSVLFCGETQAMLRAQSLFLARWMCSCCHSPSHPTWHHANTWCPTWTEQSVEIHVSNSSNYFPLFAI